MINTCWVKLLWYYVWFWVEGVFCSFLIESGAHYGSFSMAINVLHRLSSYF